MGKKGGGVKIEGRRDLYTANVDSACLYSADEGESRESGIKAGNTKETMVSVEKWRRGQEEVINSSEFNSLTLAIAQNTYYFL